MKNVNVRFWLLSGALLLASGAIVGYQTTYRSHANSFAPFVAHIVRKHFSPGGAAEPVAESYHSYARRRDGSRVHMFRVTSPNGETAQMVEISDLQTGKSVILEPFTKSSITVPLTGEQIEQRRRAESECASNRGVVVEDNGEKMGVPVTRLRDEFGAGFVVDGWISPELGCLALSELAESKSGAHNETLVTQLITSDPPDDLFKVPQGYTERSPAQVDQVYSERYNGNTLFGKKVLDTIEHRYHSGKPY